MREVHWGGPRDWWVAGPHEDTPIFDRLWNRLLLDGEIRRYEEFGRPVPPDVREAYIAHLGAMPF